MEKTRTTEYLDRWYSGDRSALDRLLARNLSWIHNHVRKRMRHNRAVEQLAEIVGTLRRGGLSEIVGDSAVTTGDQQCE